MKYILKFLEMTCIKLFCTLNIKYNKANFIKEKKDFEIYRFKDDFYYNMHLEENPEVQVQPEHLFKNISQTALFIKYFFFKCK